MSPKSVKGKVINIYLDESGNNKSIYFVIGGFYFICNNKFDEIAIREKRIIENILSIEKNIRLSDTWNSYSNMVNNEVKWANLDTPENKKYVIDSLKNKGQKNLFIIVKYDVWKPKFAKSTSTKLDHIYNYFVRLLFENILKNDSNIIKIILNYDQRNKPSDFKEYIKKEVSAKYNVVIELNSCNSIKNPLIRYADYVSGLMNSSIKEYKGISKSFEKGSFETLKKFSSTHELKIFDFFSIRTNELVDFCALINKKPFSI